MLRVESFNFDVLDRVRDRQGADEYDSCSIDIHSIETDGRRDAYIIEGPWHRENTVWDKFKRVARRLVCPFPCTSADVRSTTSEESIPSNHRNVERELPRDNSVWRAPSTLDDLLPGTSDVSAGRSARQSALGSSHADEGEAASGVARDRDGEDRATNRQPRPPASHDQLDIPALSSVQGHRENEPQYKIIARRHIYKTCRQFNSTLVNPRSRPRTDSFAYLAEQDLNEAKSAKQRDELNAALDRIEATSIGKRLTHEMRALLSRASPEEAFALTTSVTTQRLCATLPVSETNGPLGFADIDCPIETLTLAQAHARLLQADGAARPERLSGDEPYATTAHGDLSDWVKALSTDPGDLHRFMKAALDSVRDAQNNPSPGADGVIELGKYLPEVFERGELDNVIKHFPDVGHFIKLERPARRGEAVDVFTNDFEPLRCKGIRAIKRVATDDKVLERLQRFIDQSAFFKECVHGGFIRDVTPYVEAAEAYCGKRDPHGAKHKSGIERIESIFCSTEILSALGLNVEDEWVRRLIEQSPEAIVRLVNDRLDPRCADEVGAPVLPSAQRRPVDARHVDNADADKARARALELSRRVAALKPEYGISSETTGQDEQLHQQARRRADQNAAARASTQHMEKSVTRADRNRSTAVASDTATRASSRPAESSAAAADSSGWLSTEPRRDAPQLPSREKLQKLIARQYQEKHRASARARAADSSKPDGPDRARDGDYDATRIEDSAASKVAASTS